MAADSGVVEQLEARGMGAVRDEQGMCALELATGAPLLRQDSGLEFVVAKPLSHEVSMQYRCSRTQLKGLEDSTRTQLGG